VLLRLVALLTRVVVLVMLALLMHSAPAHRKLACARRRPWRSVTAVAGWLSRLIDLPAVRHIGLLFKSPELLLVCLGALHDLLLLERAQRILVLGSRLCLAATLVPWVVGVVSIVLSASAGDAGVSPALGIGGLFVSGAGFLGMLVVLVRRTRTADPFRVRMFLRHGYRSC
jgi:hypothetical protein